MPARTHHRGEIPERSGSVVQVLDHFAAQHEIELSINPERARKLRESRLPKESDVCSMCGEFCSMKGVSKYLTKDAGGQKTEVRSKT